MKLQIESHTSNQAPLRALLIKGASHRAWLQAAQPLGHSLANLRFYPLPGTEVNSLWGCLLVLPDKLGQTSEFQYPAMQCIEGQLYIPEFARLQPQLNSEELIQLLGSGQYLLHPELGFVQLEDPVDWAAMLDLPREQQAAATRPADSIHLPGEIKRFEVMALEEEDIIQILEEAVGQPGDDRPEGPLNSQEKLRLQLYKSLFKKDKEDKEKDTEKTGLMKGLESLGRFFSGKDGEWSQNWQEDFERLQERNQEALQRLLKMLKEDPERALKYAIPLDDKGSSRGGELPGSWNLHQIWGDFSLFSQRNNSSGGGGGHTFQQNAFESLQQQYRKTAEELRLKGDYKKAAFVYMKLLKDYWSAAKVLEEGHYYNEAALIYLKYHKNKDLAATAFEKGNMLSKAIDLYVELNRHEKAGDLYLQLNKEEEAMKQYQLVLDDYLKKNQYLLASFLLEDKMHQPQKAQELRLKGWRMGYDASNCLNNYFRYFKDDAKFVQEMRIIYEQDCSAHQVVTFVNLMKLEYTKRKQVKNQIQRFAFEVVAEYADKKPELVQQLQYFKPEDKKLLKDLWRFKGK